MVTVFRDPAANCPCGAGGPAAATRGWPRGVPAGPGQAEQIAQRLGLADPHLDDDQLVFDNLDDWVDAQQL